MMFKYCLKTFWKGTTLISVLLIFLQFILFDLLWCGQSTFRAMSNPALYVNAAFVSFLLVFPFMIFRKKWVWILVSILLAFHMMSVLMYYRTYFTSIPLNNYDFRLVSNVSDFMPSVVDSFRFRDVVLLIPSLCFLAVKLPVRGKSRFYYKDTVIGYFLSLFALFLLALAVSKMQGGFTASYAKMKNSCYYSSCTTPVYALYGDLLIDINSEISASKPTEDDYEEISQWLKSHAEVSPYNVLPDSLGQRTNLIVIYCESFESWVLGKTVEGQELTPFLNSLISDSTTLYAPNIVTQVGPGRSIDCQLMINAGLLPTKNGVFSMQFPNRKYLTLNQAMRDIEGSRSYILTSDKPITWNQALIAKSFEIDTLLSKDNWRNDEMVGNPPKLSDRSFVRQVVERMEAGDIWPENESAMIQIITYSGHNPFKLPDTLKRLHFSDKVPQVMADYMTVANFTDASLKPLIDYIKRRPDYDKTLVVIIGDHEGLAGYRKDILKTEIGHKFVSEKQLTPLIILNSPITGFKDGYYGQIDIYPTLLNLMRLDSFGWRGVGESIVSNNHSRSAIATMSNQIIPDSLSLGTEKMTILQTARDISDKIIRFDYFAEHQ